MVFIGNSFIVLPCRDSLVCLCFSYIKFGCNSTSIRYKVSIYTMDYHSLIRLYTVNWYLICAVLMFIAPYDSTIMLSKAVSSAIYTTYTFLSSYIGSCLNDSCVSCYQECISLRQKSSKLIFNALYQRAVLIAATD